MRCVLTIRRSERPPRRTVGRFGKFCLRPLKPLPAFPTTITVFLRVRHYGNITPENVQGTYQPLRRW